MKACRTCRRLTDKDNCPICKCKTPTTQYWGGYLGVIDAQKSEIAKRMDIKSPGEYAMKVR